MNSKYPHCENTEFEVVNFTAKNSNYELMFVRCTTEKFHTSCYIFTIIPKEA